MVQRDKASEESPAGADRSPASGPTAGRESGSETAGGPPLKGWFSRAWDRLETWLWQRQMQEREAYLAQAKDLVDLEARMRDLDGDTFLSRARTLY